jgi:protoheme IX farnesyltransferase
MQESMATNSTTMQPSVTTQCTSKFRDYYTLTKPEVNLLILMTTSAGYYLASRGPFRIAGLINTLVGTLFVASGTATLNQWMERAWDGQMRRTAGRPLPSGRLSGREAFIFGVLLSAAGGVYLAFAVNGFASLLAIFTLLSYLLVYTPLKRKTPLCTLVGAFPGAMPVLIGWAGASASIGRNAWFLFAVVFLWQFPHFLAIALMYRHDYAQAGFKMLPQFDIDSRFTRAEIVGFTVLLVITTMVPILDRGDPIYLSGMFLAGVFLLYYGIKLAQSTSNAFASRVLHASVIYLPFVLVLIVTRKA